MDRGYFKQREELGFGGSRELVPRMTCGPDMAAISWTAYEIACGMAYLHARNVVHGGEPELGAACASFQLSLQPQQLAECPCVANRLGLLRRSAVAEADGVQVGHNDQAKQSQPLLQSGQRRLCSKQLPLGHAHLLTAGFRASMLPQSGTPQPGHRVAAASDPCTPADTPTTRSPAPPRRPEGRQRAAEDGGHAARVPGQGGGLRHRARPGAAAARAVGKVRHRHPLPARAPAGGHLQQGAEASAAATRTVWSTQHCYVRRRRRPDVVCALTAC